MFFRLVFSLSEKNVKIKTADAIFRIWTFSLYDFTWNLEVKNLRAKFLGPKCWFSKYFARYRVNLLIFWTSAKHYFIFVAIRALFQELCENWLVLYFCDVCGVFVYSFFGVLCCVCAGASFCGFVVSENLLPYRDKAVMVASMLLIQKTKRVWKIRPWAWPKTVTLGPLILSRFSRHALFVARNCFGFRFANMTENGHAPEPFRAHACTTKHWHTKRGHFLLAPSFLLLPPPPFSSFLLLFPPSSSFLQSNQPAQPDTPASCATESHQIWKKMQ